VQGLGLTKGYVRLPGSLLASTGGSILPSAEDGGVRPDDTAYELPPVAGENPLLRSGLALAGANLTGNSSKVAGILTALEATGLDLWGTQLVVLSACETGVGDVHNGDGVYGLRRALVLAGSRTQVMSMWKVSDSATRDLMTGYYQRLLKGEGRSEAMRQEQLAMLKSTRNHPFYWAAFIISGEIRSLGQR
jgi:CHAT domain-containing protein